MVGSEKIAFDIFGPCAISQVLGRGENWLIHDRVEWACSSPFLDELRAAYLGIKILITRVSKQTG